MAPTLLAILIITTFLNALLFPAIVLAADDDETVEQQFGGEPISEEKYRYFTAITSRTGNFRCSGVLIGRRFVATAAHCVSGSIDTTFVDVGYFCVRRDNCGRPHEVIAIDSVATVPGDRGDFAILTLEKAPSTRPKIRPIIPDLGGKILKTLKKKSKMTLVGGGRPAEGLGPSEFVEQLTVRYIPLKKCKKRGLSRDLYGMICSEPVGGIRAGPCEGDSGGPVIVRRKGVEYLLAVHSFGKRVCGSERVKPDGHAAVSKATRLIRSVICDGAYPEDWCKEEEPAQEPANEPTEEGPGKKKKTKGPTVKGSFVSSPTKEPTTEPTTEPTFEDDGRFEPTPDGAGSRPVDEGRLFTATYAALWPVTVSSCGFVTMGALNLLCTGTDATATFLTFQPVSDETVQCIRFSDAELSCIGSSTDPSFGAIVSFQCTASSPTRLTVQATLGETAGACFGNNLGETQGVAHALRLGVLCGEDFEFDGMECADASTVVPLEEGFSCAASTSCPTTDTACVLSLNALTARIPTNPPSQCLV